MGMLKNKIDLACGPGKTKQSFKVQCDINSIVKKYQKTGMVEHVNRRSPFFGDVSEYVGLQGALDKVIAANEMFAAMSSDIRKRFHNDPVELIEFLEDKGNLPEAIKLGICLKPPTEAEKVAIAAAKPATAGDIAKVVDAVKSTNDKSTTGK